MTKTENFLPVEDYLYNTDQTERKIREYLYEQRKRVFYNGDDVWLFVCGLEDRISENHTARILEDDFFDFFDQLSVRYGLECIDGIENAAYALYHEPLMKQVFAEHGILLCNLLSIYALMRSGLPLYRKPSEEPLNTELLYPVFLRDFRTWFPSEIQLEHVNMVYPYLTDEEAMLFVSGEAGEDLYDQVQIMQEELFVRYPDFKVVLELSGLSYPKGWTQIGRDSYDGRLHKLISRVQ